MPDIKIPAVGESIATALISLWHKADGAAVAVGDVLLTLETDKVSTDLTADAAGTLKIDVPAGTEVPIGTVVGKIDESAQPSAAPATQTPPEEAIPADKNVETGPVSPVAASPSAEPPQAAPTPAAEPPAAPVFTLPQVSAAASTPATVPAPVSDGRTTRSRMSPLRRKIATHLDNAQQTAAILTTFNEVDLTAVMKLRKELQEAFTARYGVKLGFMSFFVKAVTEALKAVPQINARIDGEDLIQNHFYDIGVAVGTEKGLVVPVIRDADKKSFGEIEQAIGETAAKARDGKLTDDHNHREPCGQQPSLNHGQQCASHKDFVRNGIEKYT